MMLSKSTVTLLFGFIVLSCSPQSGRENRTPTTDKNIEWTDTAYKTIHVYVALCDNKYQGIVPVPAKIGNGQDPDNNLYWGCAFGVRTFFKKSSDWKLIQ